jgi:hypothetical protein
MVKWIQEKPEVITYLRCLYTDNALPNWVGKLEGNVNYREFLRSKGVEVPATAVDDRDSMDDVADGGSDEAGSMEDDIAEGILPLQSSTVEANDNEPWEPTGTHRHPPTVTHGNHPRKYGQAVTDTHGI